MSPSCTGTRACVWPEVGRGSGTVTTLTCDTTPTPTALRVDWWPLPSSRDKGTARYSSSLDVWACEVATCPLEVSRPHVLPACHLHWQRHRSALCCTCISPSAPETSPGTSSWRLWENQLISWGLRAPCWGLGLRGVLAWPNLLIWLPQAEHLESHADSVRCLGKHED